MEENNNVTREGGINNNWVITAILWFLLGFLGIHRFYNGKIGTGILMIFTFGGLGIWWLIDGIIIIMGKFEDKDGKVITINN